MRSGDLERPKPPTAKRRPPEFLQHGVYRCGETGVILPSVTAILALTSADHFPSSMRAVLARDHAAERGRAVHDLTAQFDAVGFYADEPEGEVEPYCQAWENFRANVGWEPVLIEDCVAEIDEGFACRIDRLMWHPHDQGFGVLEIKCTAQVESEWHLQTMAQAAACACIYDLDFRYIDRTVVRLKRDGHFQVIRHNRLFNRRDLQLWRDRLKKFHDEFLDRYVEEREIWEVECAGTDGSAAE